MRGGDANICRTFTIALSLGHEHIANTIPQHEHIANTIP
jgi:hypothetical protein